MSEENLELLRRAWDTFVRRDPAGLEYLDDDIEWELGPEVLPDGGVFRGREGYRQVIQQWGGAWDEYRLEPVEFIDAPGNRVIVVTHQSGRSRATGITVENQPVYLYTVADGRITRIQHVRAVDEALRLASAAAEADPQ
jgi:ketosteroid isomerase-like protein